jgi:molybdenum cofactor guanylyltransferase
MKYFSQRKEKPKAEFCLFFPKMKINDPRPCTAIILAGGQSRRMGRDKALLPWRGTTLIQYLYQRLAPRFAEILISSQRPGQYANVGARVVPDEEGGRGPLMGIYCGLKASSNEVNVFIPCDLPRVPLTLIRRLLSYANEYEIVVPSLEDGRTEPVLAVYTKAILPVVRRMLKTNQLTVSALFPHCKTRVVVVKNAGSWYGNLNTPDDFCRWKKASSRPV